MGVAVASHPCSLAGNEIIGVRSGGFPLEIQSQQIDRTGGSLGPDVNGDLILRLGLQLDAQFIFPLHNGVEWNGARVGVPLANPRAVDAYGNRRSSEIGDAERMVLCREWPRGLFGEADALEPDKMAAAAAPSSLTLLLAALAASLAWADFCSTSC